MSYYIKLYYDQVYLAYHGAVKLNVLLYQAVQWSSLFVKKSQDYIINNLGSVGNLNEKTS